MLKRLHLLTECAMSLTVRKSSVATCDALDQYIVSVRKLNAQIDRIAAGKAEIAGSLSRAAAALRSIAGSRAERSVVTGYSRR